MQSIELRQKRAAAIERAGAILEAAAKADRDLTADEERDWKAAHDDANKLMRQIERIEQQEQAERDLAERQHGREGRRGGEARELSPDAVLAPDETFEARARADHGDDDRRFWPMLRAALGGNVRDLRDDEWRALSTGSGAGGGFVVPVVSSGRILDKLNAAMRVQQAGAQRVALPSEGSEFVFPKHATGPAAAFVRENESLVETTLTFEAPRIEPRILACGPILAPRKLIDQSEVDMERWIGEAMAREMALKADHAALYGDGVKEPNGIVNVLTGDQDVTGTGAITSYDEMLDAIETLETANVPDATAALMHPRTANTYAKFKTATENLPLPRPPKIANLPFLSTTQISVTEGGGAASRILVGHWPHLMLAYQGTVRILPLRERYADKLQVGFIAYVYYDTALMYDESIVSIGGVTV